MAKVGIVHYPEENGSWEFLMTEYYAQQVYHTDGLELQQPYSFIKDNVKILPNRNYIPTWILCKCWNF
jgi:hypothetical protein